MPVPRILAVAVAENRTDDLPIGSPKHAKGGILGMKVRPYVQGLIQRLEVKGWRLGHDYQIHFRQREVANLNAAAFARPGAGNANYVIFCMSTNVARYAAIEK